MDTFICKIQVRFNDFDSQKIVNHTKISEYIETAYVDFFKEKINTDWSYESIPLVLRKEITEFLIPVTGDSKPVCRIQVSEVRRSSFTLLIAVMDDDSAKTYAIAERVIVHIDFETKRPVSLDEMIKENLNLFKI